MRGAGTARPQARGTSVRTPLQADGRGRAAGLVDAPGRFVAGRARPGLQARHPRSAPYEVNQRLHQTGSDVVCSMSSTEDLVAGPLGHRRRFPPLHVAAYIRTHPGPCRR